MIGSVNCIRCLRWDDAETEVAMKSLIETAIGAVLSMFLEAAPCAAQGLPADSAGGRELAGKLCASCHATDPDGKAVSRADVPSFRAIAKAPLTTPERLAGAIIMPHPAMPGVPLTRAESRGIIAYIMSLRVAP